ncbi:MAG: GNAT family N-acetyltransferase [Desulfobacterales bacterium]
MDLKEYCPEKLATAEEAVSHIKPGSRVFIGTGAGEPSHLVKAMINNDNLYDIMIYQMLSWTLADYINDENFLSRFSLKLFFISSNMRDAAFQGKIDYIPAYISKIPTLFATRQIGLDVALVQVSPPDEFGYCSLGISVDITRAGLEHAGMVIAQINPRMPRTFGATYVHVDEVDYLVLHEEQLVETVRTGRSREREVTERIGHYVSQLVDDGATLQIGFGFLPLSILRYLDDKKDLGIHTQMITDSFLPLFKKGVINNRKKTLLPGMVVASLCMGTEKIYQYVDRNPMFYFRSSDFVNDPIQIARNDNMISISSALEVDLTGQVCSDSMGSLFYSGIGDQVDFLRGCSMSKGGISIIALPSTAKNGTVSRIVPFLSEGAGVATTRGDVDFVVTEYGIAALQGKGIYQRVMELAQIAHPDFRSELIDLAKKRRYIFADQLPPAQEDLLFIEKYKSTITLKNGKSMEVRPLLPSDEFAFRNFYYSLQEHTIFLRFFYDMKLFSHEVVQMEWSKVDYRKNMSLIGLIKVGGHKEIKAIGSYAEGGNDTAEIAFVISEEFQGLGIASQLLDKLEKIARENGYKRFGASVMRENMAMLRVFRKKYPNAEITLSDTDEYRVIMEFDEPKKKARRLLAEEMKKKVMNDLKHRVEDEFSKVFWNDFKRVEAFDALVEDMTRKETNPDQVAREFVSKWLMGKKP